jgi:hypothetical protein
MALGREAQRAQSSRTMAPSTLFSDVELISTTRASALGSALNLKVSIKWSFSAGPGKDCAVR